MLPKVTVSRYCCAPFTDVNSYRHLVGDALIEEIRALARDLKGARICHLNATSYGGGVAELLVRHVPLARALGLEVDWRVIPGTPRFFAITKALHNALQGADYTFSEDELGLYLEVNRQAATHLEERYDLIVVHDPQPAAIRAAAGANGAKWIWRCHIDTSAPNPAVAQFLLPLLQAYDAAVFTMREFVLPGIAVPRLAIIPPAIDPLSTKNMDLDPVLCRAVVANSGVDTNRPLIVQVARFDPWKDPMGVIAAYRLAKQEVPGLQLALVGAIAGDDPEGWQLLARVQEEATTDDDIHVFTNLAGVGNLEVNAFQSACDVVVQKSLREGFGLVVSEALWKSRPIVAGRAGGIGMQMPPGYEQYLVTTAEQCASAIVALLDSPPDAAAFGAAGRQHVRRHFLLPRLLRDELLLMRDLLCGGAAPGTVASAPLTQVSAAAGTGSEQWPVGAAAGGIHPSTGASS